MIVAIVKCNLCGNHKPVSAMRQEWPIEGNADLYWFLCNDDDNCHTKWITSGRPMLG